MNQETIKALGHYSLVGDMHLPPASEDGKTYLSHGFMAAAAHRLANFLRLHFTKVIGSRDMRVYAIPRGGIPAAYLLANWINVVMVESPDEADILIDDIIDSGATKAKFAQSHPDKPFFALIDKTPDMGWLVFPWERKVDGSDGEGIEDNIRRILQYVGEDPTREGLLETPKRVAKAWKHWCQGYHQDPTAVLKTFEDGAEGTDEMVIVRNIELYSHCEHHMAPFFGVAHVAYIPNKKIVGLSKLARVTDIFAQRLQVQERLTNQIADCIQETLNPIGVGVVIEAKHFCMCSRGVGKQGSTTITSALRGAIKDKPAARAEFLALAKP